MALSHSLIGGKLHIYKRENSPFWQCSTYIAGRNHRSSTKEEELERAKAKAEDWYLTLQLKKRTGELRGAKTFNDAADKFLPEYQALTHGERSPRYVKQHDDRLRVHLRPFFGNMPVSDITDQTVQDYRVHRMTSKKHKKTGEPMRPARTTLHHEIVTLRHVLRTARRQGWIKLLPDLSSPYKANSKVTHRAWFSHDEYKKLYTATRERAENPPKAQWKWECEQLHDFVIFTANTGLRPDEDAQLEFRDVEIVKDRNSGETILEIDVRGKRGVGYCKSMPAAVFAFERLRQRKRLVEPTRHGSRGADDEKAELRLPEPTDKIFPNSWREHFNSVLDELDLKFDRNGLRRSAYSLRHTYVCFRLMEGADIYQIAKNCRTSVEMIEKYYASHIKHMIDASSVNVRRSRSNDRPEQRERKPKAPPANKNGRFSKPRR